MADEENLQEMVEDNDDTEPALISTPTQDELPDFISLPGVSASGIQAAASALRGLRSSQGMDEISDSELNVDQDLGDLAVLPVDKPDEEDRLSGVSNVSSVKEKENDKKDDDEISLSGLSSNDDDPNRLQIEDVEDGEITKTVANVEMNGTASHRTRSRSSSSDSSTTPNAGNGKNRSRRRFRKRSSGSSEKNSSEERNQSLRKSQSPSRSRSRSRRSGTPRSSVPKRRNQKELPRYDVRNVINRKRAARTSKRKSKSPSRSRSKSRSRRRGRSKSRSRSKSPVSAFRSRNASRRSPIRSRSPVRNSGGNKRSKRPQRSWSPSKSRSRSHSPPPRNRFRSRQRSRSPMLRRNRTRSPLRNRSRSPPLRNRLDRSKSPKSKKRSPRSARNTKKKNKPRSKSRSRSRSPVTARKSKGKKKNRPNRVNDTDSTSKSKKKSKKSKRNNRTVTAANDNNDVHFNSSVANKEVYTSGDKIMVSVNFKNAANKSAAEIAASTKPSLVIDVMSSPYQIIEPSPEPVFDIFSDDEKENNQSKIVNENQENLIDIEQQERTSGGADLHIIEELSRGGPCTPPTENLDLAKGPQTPTEDPMDYDPCNPTESPLDDSLEIDDAPLIASSPSSSDGSNNGHRDELLKTAANTIPFLMDDSLVSNNSKATAAEKNNDTNDLNDMPIDMDMDSPFSPASSEASDIFEPPSLKGHKKSKTNGIKSHKAGASNNNKHVKMKVVDDKLKIIDDVPTSAVEMAVKEKFLKKVQRQERIVEEIKTVLKPHYNRKRITKEDYKDILRKCVPKVCHSKKGDINPTKIQKLVKGYVRKYHHSRKRMLNSS